jgi:hypothetical protein
MYKTREQEGETGSIWGVGTSRRGKDIRKASETVNMTEIFCTHVCKNEKMRHVETILGMGEREGNRTMEGVNSTMINCKKFCKCLNVLLIKQK